MADTLNIVEVLEVFESILNNSDRFCGEMPERLWQRIENVTSKVAKIVNAQGLTYSSDDLASEHKGSTDCEVEVLKVDNLRLRKALSDVVIHTKGYGELAGKESGTRKEVLDIANRALYPPAIIDNFPESWVDAVNGPEIVELTCEDMRLMSIRIKAKVLACNVNDLLKELD